MDGNKWWGYLCSQVPSTGLVSTVKGTETFLITIANTYWVIMYPTPCHLFYALPHCTLEIGTDIISVYRWGNQGLGRWSNLLSVIQLVSGGPGGHTQLCVHRALLHAASSEIVIFPGGPRCGRVWREWLAYVLTAAYTVSWICFEAASSALASQKAPSPLGLVFMMWFPSCCLWRSALLPQDRKAHWLLINCYAGVTSCVQDGALLYHSMAIQRCCEGLISAGQMGIGAHVLSTTLLLSPPMPVM